MSNETPQVVDKETPAREIVVNAAMGGMYESIGNLIREAGHEDSSGYRRFLATKIKAGEYAEVADLLSVSEGRIRETFGTPARYSEAYAMVCKCGHSEYHHKDRGGLCDTGDGCLGLIIDDNLTAEFGAGIKAMKTSANPTKVVDKRRFTNLSIEQSQVIAEVEEAVDKFMAGESQFSPSSQPSTSPGMDFGTALKQVLKGQPVTRLEWENPSIYLLLYRCRVPNFGVEDGNYLSIHRANGTVGPLFVSDNDLRADDWIVVV